MKEIKGVIVPILTPMREDGTINSEELVNQIERLIDAGIHGIFVLGTNGEGYILDEDEKTEVIRVAVNTVNGRVPVYAGTGCVSTRDTVRMSRKAKELGADVLSIITPSFAAASQEELIRHYETVAKTVDMPILLYNIPARTGNALAPATVQKLSQVPNIIGVKDSSGNFDNILQYIEKTRGGEKPFASVYDAQMSGIAQFIDGTRELTPDNWAAFQQEMNDLGLSRIEEIQLAAYQAMYGA